MLSVQIDRRVDYNTWPADMLIRYIEKEHHRYVREQASSLNAILLELCSLEGKRYPALQDIAHIFSICTTKLVNHMYREEQIYFPYIRQQVNDTKRGFLSERPVELSSISFQQLIHEHEDDCLADIETVCNLFNAISTNGFSYPHTIALLENFREDLQFHIELENTILFPKTQFL